MTVTEHIAIDRDPLLALKDAHDALQFCLMHPAALGRAMPMKRIKQLEIALSLIETATRESDVL